MEIYTIGFTHCSAEDFFGALRRAGIRRLIDTRLNNTSQLAVFAKRYDLAFFLQELVEADYHEEPLLVPTQELLDAYKKRRIDWAEYEVSYRELLDRREVDRTLDRGLFEVPAVLLCSERTPEHCHRRLAVEHLASTWGDVTVVHLELMAERIVVNHLTRMRDGHVCVAGTCAGRSTRSSPTASRALDTRASPPPSRVRGRSRRRTGRGAAGRAYSKVEDVIVLDERNLRRRREGVAHPPWTGQPSLRR